MKILIDISAEDFEKVKCGRGAVSMMRRAIIHGTPLPDTNSNLQLTCNQLATDCISRQAVIDRINKLIEVEKKQGTDDWGYGRERVNAYEAMLHFVKSEYLYPSVEPERKTGKWHVEGFNVWCTNCGFHPKAIEVFDYCPMCGVKMEVDNGK